MMPAPDVRGLFAALASDRASVRFAAAKALCEWSLTEPVRVYRHFDRIAGLFRQRNRILRWNAMRMLANVARVDRAGRIDGLIDEYLAPITGGVLISAAHAIEGAAKIAVAKPYLAAYIADQVLKVEQAQYATAECRNVAIGHALKALEQIAPLAENKLPIRDFAERQLTNSRVSTRRKAQRLLDRLKIGGIAKTG